MTIQPGNIVQCGKKYLLVAKVILHDSGCIELLGNEVKGQVTKYMSFTEPTVVNTDFVLKEVSR